MADRRGAIGLVYSVGAFAANAVHVEHEPGSQDFVFAAKCLYAQLVVGLV
jgi:hypothetical protein